MACARELGLDEGKLNVNGGAIAIGHPLGATGVRLALTLARELKRAQLRYGIASACIGGGPANRLVGPDGPMPLADFERVIKINLIGTFNMMRLVAADMQGVPQLADGERGVIISTASVAAFEGQIGQPAYAASKGGVAALTMPAARELAQFGIRANAIAPGIFHTTMLSALPEEAQKS